MIQTLNNFLHLPIIKGLFWYAWWTIIIMCTPLALLFLFILFIYDVLAGIFEFQSIGHGWFNHRFLEPSPNKPIIITGCGSGIGKASAIALARRGWKVYAGCRSAESIQELESLYIPSLIPIQLNVNNEANITSVIEIIMQHNEHGLFCLINNAGIIHNGPIDWISLESFRQVKETNYFSVVALTKACLPLLKKHSRKTGNARIVQIGSASGLSWGIQFFAGYAASKHAVEAFSSSLRGELKPFNIHVSTLNPMIHKTGMTNVERVTDSIHNLFESLSPRKQQEYGKDYLDYFVKNHTEYMEKNSWDVNNVIREVVHAATAKTPCIQYLQGLELLTVGGILNMIPRPINEYLMSLNGGYIHGQEKIQK